MANWNDRYRGDEYFYGREPNDFLRECANQMPRAGRILCLAEGEGRNAVYLASLGFDVVAVDASEVGLEKLRKLAAERGVTVESIQSDLETFSILEAGWDGIVSIWCHVPSSLRKSLHEKCVRGLKPGGVFILESYRPEQLQFGTGGPKDRDFLPTLEELKVELSSLDFLHAKNLEREVSEGQGHQGQSAVVQIVARQKSAA